jgi:hypothetical protein
METLLLTDLGPIDSEHFRTACTVALGNQSRPFPLAISLRVTEPDDDIGEYSRSHSAKRSCYSEIVLCELAVLPTAMSNVPVVAATRDQ